MQSSYSGEEVEILLTDITGKVEALPTSIREKMIQSGIHYSAMLPLEYEPTEEYLEAYNNALKNYAKSTAIAIEVLSEKIYRNKGKEVVIVSLARAGLPIGILVKKYLEKKYRITVKHYAISIIRGIGIDDNAMKYILQRHKASSIQFVDGWTGKGAILRQLRDALMNYPEVDHELGVVADPANLTSLCGTHDDILIPSSCLNATVTGLISRTFYREDIIGPEDFHGAAFYSSLKNSDLSRQFLESIESEFAFTSSNYVALNSYNSNEIVTNIIKEYNINDVNFVKPGIGETTRVLLRRIPWKIIVNSEYINANELNHIKQLANEKNVTYEISKVPLGNYKVCGIIKKMQDI